MTEIVVKRRTRTGGMVEETIDVSRLVDKVLELYSSQTEARFLYEGELVAYVWRSEIGWHDPKSGQFRKFKYWIDDAVVNPNTSTLNK